ncbi:hypothetical protein Hypma_002824 [Hypsizygus marmoreus]|uniref:Uncharacterized protein n=1 Tax=Hypsizygus marmoreus TaxID=39966 RepID=A0A369JA26_HYPMA|nr:hypothetical protein Hypma_002824 [Hypsizygus marmoreus]
MRLFGFTFGNDDSSSDEELCHTQDSVDEEPSSESDASTPHPNQIPERPSPSVDDVFTARDLLLHFLPLELVYVIFDTAEYWPKISAESMRSIDVPADHTNGNNAAAYCVVTHSIPQILCGSKPIPLTVKRVTFSLVSCDQGWGGEIRTRGTYQDSYTWFEAAIIQGSGADVATRLMSLGAMNADVFNAKAYSRTSGAEIENPLEPTKRWHLQTNIQVSSVRKSHVVEWTDGDIIDDAETDAKAHGRGTGRGFIHSLAPGCGVAVVARAQYPGWTNHVESVKVEIFYSPT